VISPEFDPVSEAQRVQRPPANSLGENLRRVRTYSAPEGISRRAYGV
jgi:hypothetical protein